MDKALCRAMTPHQRQPGAYGRCLLEQPLHDGSSLLHTGLLYLRDPGITRVASTRTDHAAEGLDLVIRAGHHWVKAEETSEEGLSARAPVFRVRQPQACRSEGRPGGGTVLVMVFRIEGHRCHLSDVEACPRLSPPLADVPRHRHP